VSRDIELRRMVNGSVRRFADPLITPPGAALNFYVDL